MIAQGECKDNFYFLIYFFSCRYSRYESFPKIRHEYWIFFLLMAALLLVSLGLSFLYYDTSSVTQNFFAYIGLALVSIYGYSSLLVPVFLFASGIVLFLPPWNTKKAFLLAFSLLPFFTVVFAEKLIKTMTQESSQAIMRLQIFGIFVVAIIMLKSSTSLQILFLMQRLKS